MVRRAWNNLIAPLGNQENWGTIGPDDALAPMLGRALLSAGARRDDEQWDAISGQFRSRAAAVRTLARIVAASFQIDETELPVPADDVEVETALDAALDVAK